LFGHFLLLGSDGVVALFRSRVDCERDGKVGWYESC